MIGGNSARHDPDQAATASHPWRWIATCFGGVAAVAIGAMSAALTEVAVLDHGLRAAADAAAHEPPGSAGAAVA